MTDEMKSAPVGVEDLIRRIDAAIERVTSGRCTMRVPADPTDPDLVLADAGNWIQRHALVQQPAAVDEASAWKPISEAPAGKLCIVGWQVVEAGEYPDRHEFDYIEDGRWVHHDESVDYAAAVAPGGSKMPAEDPPYQWFIEVPAFPDTAAQRGGHR